MSDIKCSESMVSRHISMCKKLGLITQDEIDVAKESKKIEKEKTKLEKNEQVQKILEYRRQGLSASKISKMPDIKYSQPVISDYIKKCKKVGLIVQEENIEHEINRLMKNEQIQKILEYKKQGYLDINISKMPDIKYSQPTVSKYVRKFIEYGLIPQERISENERNEQIKKILEYKRQGYTDSEIFMMPDIKYKLSTVSMHMKKSVELGLITEQEIIEAKKKRKKQESNLKITEDNIEELKKDEQVQKILEYKKQGYSNKKISEMSDIKYSLHNISECIRTCKQLGLITEEEIDNKKDEQIQRIFEYVKQGFSVNKISKMPDIKYSRYTISKYIRIGVKQGLINDEEIKKDNQKQLLKEKMINKKIEENKQKEIMANTEETIEKQKRQEIRRKEIEMYQLKRQIDTYVRFNINPSKEKAVEIRQYVELCFKIYEKEKIPKLELQFLKNALSKISINYKDIAKYSKICINSGENEEALKMITNIDEMKEVSISEDEKKRLKNIQKTLLKVCKVQQAMNIIKKGNVNSEVLCKTTGLSMEEINYLKIRMLNKPVRFLSIKNREKIIDLLMQKQEPEKIQEKFGITDFEMEDIKQQVKYRKINPENRDFQMQIKQDTYIRMIALFTKLGKKESQIAQILKTNQDEVHKNIDLALKGEIITKEQLNGINILKSQNYDFGQLEK